MKSFSNYYRELFEEIPEDFSIFGKFGEGCWSDMISEGLITSYPRKKVLEFLNSYDPSEFSMMVPEYQHDPCAIDIMINNSTLSLENVKTIINGKLKVYGWFVGKVSMPDHFGTVKFILEMKHPSILKDDEKLDAPFYHLTYNFLLPKIRKNGLTPRESTTSFSHPGGRIYLLQTTSENILQLLMNRLSMAKIQHAKSDALKWSIENMVVLDVNVDGLVLYKDPMFPHHRSYNAVFTTQNISPDKLKQSLIKTES